jgi:hypothetical protein
MMHVVKKVMEHAKEECETISKKYKMHSDLRLVNLPNL